MDKELIPMFLFSIFSLSLSHSFWFREKQQSSHIVSAYIIALQWYLELKNTEYPGLGIKEPQSG